MKILVQSTYKQNDEWGRSALDYLRCFKMTGNEIRTKPIILSNQLRQENIDRVTEDPNFKYDVIFQQCLPEYFESVPNSIGMTFTETNHLDKTGWIEAMNSQNCMVVATEQEKNNLIDSGVTTPIYVVYMPMELKKGEPNNKFQRYIQDRYCFYFIGEYVERKNIEAIISAYWRTFKANEPVVLLIKTNYGGVSSSDLLQHTHNVLGALRKKMRLYKYDHHYPEVIFITDHLSDQEMRDLHASADCFINASRGESTCRPMIDAALHNRRILCTDCIGSLDLDLDIQAVKSYEVPASANMPPLPYLYTGWETWREIDQIDLGKQMRLSVGKYAINEDKVYEKYSYASVTSQLNYVLNEWK